MKKFRGISLVAGLAVTALTISGCAAPEELTPAPSASSTTSTSTEAESFSCPAETITVAWNDLIDEFNGNSIDGNNVANSVPLYMMGSGFSYYNNSPELIINTDFGTYELVNEDPLTVKYTVNDDVVWSDGTPLDGADLLLAWATIFGYGQAEDGTYMFLHANPREDLASKIPTVDGKSITFEYDKQYVDWELQFGYGVSAHGTVMMAYPEITDPSVAKWALMGAIKDNDLDWLAPVAEVWNTGYASTNTPENELISLSSGPYMLAELVEESYVTLVKNPLYTWGPEPVYDCITVRQVEDSTAAVQAVDNGEIQIASGQPTADVLQLVQGLANGSFQTGDEAAYEHVDLSFANGGPFDPATYGGNEQTARLVRQAFLLSVPREEILDKLIKPLNPNAEVRQSNIFIPGAPGYDEAVELNAFYNGTDEENRAKAKQLLAQAGVSTPIDVEFWYPDGNARRASEFELIKLSADSVGFNVISEAEPDWAWIGTVPHPHDAVIFAWASGSLAVTGSDQYFGTGKPSNFQGYSNPELDAILAQLDVELDPVRQMEIKLEVDRIVAEDAVRISIFQFPGLTWWDNSIDNVSGSIFVPYYFWNFWEWAPAL